MNGNELDILGRDLGDLAASETIFDGTTVDAILNDLETLVLYDYLDKFETNVTRYDIEVCLIFDTAKQCQ